MDFKEGLFKDRICNYESLNKPQFKEWVDTIFSIGLCGLDFSDVHDILNNKNATLSTIIVQDISDLKNRIVKEVNPNTTGVIAGLKIPKTFGLDEINKIAEIIVGQLKKNVDVLWQAVHHSEDNIKVILLKVSDTS